MSKLHLEPTEDLVCGQSLSGLSAEVERHFSLTTTE